MTDTRFFSLLTVVTGSTLILGYASSFMSYFGETWPFASSSIVFFTVLTIAAHYAGKKASRSSNPNHLTQLIMGLVFFKLICCLGLILIYNKVFKPVNNHYLVSFFVIYLVYTIFEVVLLTKVNKLHTNV